VEDLLFSFTFYHVKHATLLHDFRKSSARTKIAHGPLWSGGSHWKSYLCLNLHEFFLSVVSIPHQQSLSYKRTSLTCRHEISCHRARSGVRGIPSPRPCRGDVTYTPQGLNVILYIHMMTPLTLRYQVYGSAATAACGSAVVTKLGSGKSPHLFPTCSCSVVLTPHVL
jgi:hypothetical protein